MGTIGAGNIFKRVLTISTDPGSKGGIASVVCAYQSAFKPFKHITSTSGRGTWLSPTVGKSSWYNYLVFAVALLKLVLFLTFDWKIRIIHIHGASYKSFHRKYVFFLIAKNIYRKKVIFHVHGGRFHNFYNEASPPLKRKIKNLIEKADALICLSDEWGSFFSANFKAKEIVVLNNVVVRPDISNKKKRVEGEKLVLLFLSSISKHKGVWDLLDVLNKNRENWAGKVALKVGGHGEVEQFKKQVADLNLENFVKFLGWITDQEKQNELLGADIYVMPSYFEGVPISIIEAMSFHLPIISTNVGGIPQVVKNEKNGFLIAPGDQKQLSDSIDYFVKNPQYCKVFGDYSETLAKDYYMENVLPRLVKIYTSLIQK